MKSGNFYCSQCGQNYSKWQGRCQSCGEWNVIQEAKFATKKSKTTNTQFSNYSGDGKTLKLSQAVEKAEAKKVHFEQLKTLFPDGVQSGAVILIYGEPGIGKSTLFLQLAMHREAVFYQSGEESIQQIARRKSRLFGENGDLLVSTEVEVDQLLEAIEKEKAELVFIDSIQTLYSSQIEGGPGSVSQIRYCAQKLIRDAKTQGYSLFLSGHITKSGDAAGPKILEHMVDASLHMSQEPNLQRFGDLRLIQSVKNRYASTEGVISYEMTGKGLKAVSSGLMKMHQNENSENNYIYYPHKINQSVFISEIECLVNPSIHTPVRRVCEGIQLNRLLRLLAILEKHARLNFSSSDVFVQITGGIRSEDVDMDLSLIAAIYCSIKKIQLPQQYFFLGEAGLSGQIRPLKQYESRKKNLEQFGNYQVLAYQTPKFNIKNIHGLIQCLESIKIH